MREAQYNSVALTPAEPTSWSSPSPRARSCLEHPPDDRELYAATVAALDGELGWRLTPAQQQAYVAALLDLGRLPAAGSGLRKLITNYHLDHMLVAALRDRALPDHDASWQIWLTDTARILRGHFSAAQRDLLGDLEDLSQQALEDLARALPSYRYRSRFSSWAYSVIVHSAMRTLRHLQAEKRRQRTEPLDAQAAHLHATAEHSQPQRVAEFNAFVEQLAAVLAAQPDPRWQVIFRLWAHEDQRLVDIAQQQGLSQARVSILLGQILAMLRTHPNILAWLDLPPLDERASGADLPEGL